MVHRELIITRWLGTDCLRFTLCLSLPAMAARSPMVQTAADAPLPQGVCYQLAIQLFLAPSRIHARMALRSQIDNFLLPCGMRTSGEARQSRSHIKLLPSGSRGTTMAPNLVPFINPS